MALHAHGYQRYELKLASGLSAGHRLKDLADVQELVLANHLPESFAERLDPSVRDAPAPLARRAVGPGYSGVT